MSRTTLYALMALHVVCSSGGYIFGKAAAVGFEDPAVLTLARALGAALIFLLGTGTLVPRPRFTPREWLQLLGFAFLLVPCNQYCFLRGLQHTVPSHPALFYALTPLGVLALDSLLSARRPPGVKLAGVVLALAGVVVILRPWERGETFSQIRTGDYWIMGAVASWIIYTVVVQPICRRHDPRTVTAWSLIIGAALMLPVAGKDLAALPMAMIPVDVWLSLAWLTIVTSVVMMLLWNLLLRNLTPVEVAICTNAQPPTTVLLAAAMTAVGFLDRQPDLGSLFFAGMLMVMGGVLLVQLRP
ncbi:MAG: DMT family transporter [Desulfobacterales bacterium]|nr:DMT family transporter [Desulfobacterales bacterium]